MNLGIDKAKLLQYRAQVVRLLGEPVKMRLAVTVVLAGLGAGAVYMPLSDQIDGTRRLLAVEQKRFEAIKDVESLRREVDSYRSRISDKSDTNEWVRYLLAGSRQAQVRLRGMEARDPAKVGPYKAITLIVEIEGAYGQLKQFVEWVEQSDRLLRVDTLRVEKQPGTLLMKVYILGLVRKNA